MQPSEVFLSHSDRNRDAASQLVEVLTRHGVPVWYSRKDILGAQQWHDEIGAALARCDWFLLLLSPAAVHSAWVKHELMYVLRVDRYQGRIVPLIYEKCDHAALSWTLGGLQMLDLSDDFGRGCRELLRIWGIGYRELSSTQQGPT